MQVHRYETSGEAYDDSQCNAEVRDGDVLVVDGFTEKSAAVLMGAWPICVNPDFVTDVDTAFHCPRPGFSVEDVAEDHCRTDLTPYDFYTESIRVAREEWRKLTARA